MTKTDGDKRHISLCMITRNEEKYLERCLASAAQLIDELILVDTGSTDRTKEIARQFGARIFDFKWNEDFAAARNFCLQHATGEWILVLDADEYLDADSAAKIPDLTGSTDAADIFLLPVKNLMVPELGEYQTSLVLRLFKNSKELRYSGKIHEQILVPADKRVKIAETGPYIIHLGYLDQRRAKKNHRNMKMLKAALKEDPDNPYLHFYISTEYILLKDYKTALKHVRKALTGIPSEVILFRTACIRNAVICFSELSEFDEALNILVPEIEKHKAFPDYYYYLGNLNRIKGCFEEAVRQYNRALSVTEPPLAGCSISGSNGYKSLHYRGLCLQELRRYWEAIDSFKASLDQNPSYILPLGDLVRCLLLLEGPEECLLYLEKSFDIVSSDLCLMVAQVLFSEGYPEFARAYFYEKDYCSESPAVTCFLGELALADNNLPDANHYFAGVPDHSPLYVTSLIFRCISFWKQNKTARKIISTLKGAGVDKTITKIMITLDNALYGKKPYTFHDLTLKDLNACNQFMLDLFRKLIDLNMYQHAIFLYGWLTNTDPCIRKDLDYHFRRRRCFLKGQDIVQAERNVDTPADYLELADVYQKLSSVYLKNVPVLPEKSSKQTR